jgi:glutathione S-transferase
MPHWTALVTVLRVLFYFHPGVDVVEARAQCGLPAPAMSGNPDFARVFSVQANTLEWVPTFLP